MDQFVALFKEDVEPQLIKYLKAGINDALVRAVKDENCKVESVRVLMDAGAKPTEIHNAKYPFETVLWLIIESQRADILELVLESKYRPNVILSDIYHACRCGSPEILRVLKPYIIKYTVEGIPHMLCLGHVDKLRKSQMIKEAAKQDKIDNIAFLLQEGLVDLFAIGMVLSDVKKGEYSLDSNVIQYLQKISC